MAITLTTILGTDSLTATRPIINDNFSILKDEINSLESYIDPDTGTIDGLASLQTTELNVGPTTNYLMQINSSNFDINTSVNFISPASTVKFSGLIAHDSFAILNASATNSPYTMPSIGVRNYSVINTETSQYDIYVPDGIPGQEVTFFCENISAAINLEQAGSSSFVLGGTLSTISLDSIGSTVTLRFMTDSSGNEAWYIVSSYNVTLT